MQEKYKEFWLKKDKEEIIEAFGDCIHNGEVLYKRIQDSLDFIDRYLSLNLEAFNSESLLKKLSKILRGEE